MARRGLILGQDEATPSRKLFRYLPDPPAPVLASKAGKKIKNQTSWKKMSKKHDFFLFSPHSYRLRAGQLWAIELLSWWMVQSWALRLPI